MKKYTVTDNGIEVSILAPGVKMENIDINAYDDNRLTVFLPENKFYYQRKYAEKFSDMLDVGNSTASLEDGILTINIPYAESKKPRRIAIKELKALE
jgi:HSP20 family molecular chaperone IbpA